MDSVLRKLLRIATEKNLPVVVYDSQSERAGVLMDLDYFETHFESNEGWNENLEENDEETPFEQETPSFSPVNAEEDDMEDIDETNKNLALWRAQREEKEREEIEKALEEELIENPLADPFEEDYLHTPEWHKISDAIELDNKTTDAAPDKEPSYHPVLNSGGSLIWTDWTFAPTSSFEKAPETIILQEIEEEISPEGSDEAPVFLEEPV